MTNYEKGELVWAKIIGFPWWPGIVPPINKKLNPLFVLGYFLYPKSFSRG